MFADVRNAANKRLGDTRRRFGAKQPSSSDAAPAKRCCDFQNAQLNGGISPRRIRWNLRHLAGKLCSRRDKPKTESNSAHARAEFRGSPHALVEH
jgi:hypothetical protein